MGKPVARSYLGLPNYMKKYNRLQPIWVGLWKASVVAHWVSDQDILDNNRNWDESVRSTTTTVEPDKRIGWNEARCIVAYRYGTTTKSSVAWQIYKEETISRRGSGSVIWFSIQGIQREDDHPVVRALWGGSRFWQWIRKNLHYWWSQSFFFGQWTHAMIISKTYVQGRICFKHFNSRWF